jgi:hypothetical protein
MEKDLIKEEALDRKVWLGIDWRSLRTLRLRPTTNKIGKRCSRRRRRRRRRRW